MAVRGRKSMGERVTTAVRIPVDLHARLVAVCDERDTTINHLAVKSIQHYLDNVLVPIDPPQVARTEEP